MLAVILHRLVLGDVCETQLASFGLGPWIFPRNKYSGYIHGLGQAPKARRPEKGGPLGYARA